MGVIRVAYVALEHMSKQSGGRGGVIINTSSLAGLGPLPSCPVYTATKHAVIGFTRAMAMASLGLDYGVRFNALCPGFVDTHLFSNIPLRLGKFSDLKDLTLRLVHNFGIMKVGDVAQSLMELLSDHTRTGEALVVQPSGNKYAEFPSQA
ncbi:unnamed protein product [Knipowitschia caucasica]|uniref:Uncharacterized protein n=1 Tax=Knipowitschia caucasica TaxID=637954 RepID=A0AAV2J9P2_KNICA